MNLSIIVKTPSPHTHIYYCCKRPTNSIIGYPRSSFMSIGLLNSNFPNGFLSDTVVQLLAYHVITSQSWGPGFKPWKWQKRCSCFCSRYSPSWPTCKISTLGDYLSEVRAVQVRLAATLIPLMPYNIEGAKV